MQGEVPVVHGRNEIREQDAARLQTNARRMTIAIVAALAVLLFAYNLAVDGPAEADSVGFWATTVLDIVVGAAATIGVALLAFWIARRGGVMRR